MADHPGVNRMDELIKDIKDFGRGSVSWSKQDEFENKYKKTLVKTLGDLREDEKAKLEEVMYAAIRTGNSNVMETVANPIFEKRKLVDWKNRQDFVYKIVDTLIESATENDEDSTSYHFSGFSTKFMETLKGYQILSKHSSKLYTVIRTALKSYEKPDAPIHNASLTFITQFPWIDQPDLIVESVRLIKEAVKHNADVSESAWLATNLGIIYAVMFRSLNGKNVHMKALSDVAETFNFCAEQDFQYSEDPSKKTITYNLLKSIMEDFLSAGSTTPELVKPMMGSIRELWECGDETLQRDANYIVTAMADKMDLVGDQTEVLLDQFLSGKQATLASKLVEMYKSKPEAFYPRLPRFLELTNNESWYKILIVQLFAEVAKTAPEKLPKETLPTMVGLLNDSTAVYSAIMLIDAMAARDPKSIFPYDEQLINAMNHTENAMTMIANVLAKLSIDQAHQRKYLRVLANIVTKTSAGPQQVGMLWSMRTIGVNCPKILAEHKKLFETLRSRADLKDVCQSALDVIEGRSLENVVGEMSEQRKDIKVLDTRVAATEDNVANLSTEVGQNKADIKQVKGDVAKHSQKLDELQTVVDETVEKVDEIDHKTLSHAPAWSIDVAKMLNPKADHDWRLLASRLGYSNDDIRNWATQPNPCLSMFDEWFATHKTREATYGILKTLVEMDRMDASVLVEAALKKVENVVEDEEEEPDVPPPVFLSYQWAHQSEVKLLKRHLSMAGYSSWMDIGQMGGGDKLFAKIDKGIRAAKVIVCCVTERYAESPNCNREVNLSVTLGKPVIPLLMEKMSWPPPGSMGPIFGEYIFVRFFQRPEEATGDERYWATDKFTELLMQLRYNIAPDTSVIGKESPYKNWWQPPEEVIVIKPKSQKQLAGAGGTLTSVESPDKSSKSTPVSPEIFLSYQWGKQPQIKALYRRLMQHGYTCWLDIMQMGGGDSLYDKIDRGVRGCKVVLSCVTSKYALSANCRREVSLADAIKKPIIPLLLEKSSWPPEGPMGMVFTQLLYIDFCKPNEDIQKEWNCPQFNELLQKIQHHLPPTSEARDMSKHDRGDSQKIQSTTRRQSTDSKTVGETAPRTGSRPTPPSPPKKPISVGPPVATGTPARNPTKPMALSKSEGSSGTSSRGGITSTTHGKVTNSGENNGIGQSGQNLTPENNNESAKRADMLSRQSSGKSNSSEQSSCCIIS